MAITLVHQQLDTGIAAGIQGQCPELTYLQPLEPERSPFAQTGEILCLQGQLDAAALCLALQGHGVDPFTGFIVQTNGGPGQQAIRVLDPGRGERPSPTPGDSCRSPGTPARG